MVLPPEKKITIPVTGFSAKRVGVTGAYLLTLS